MSDWVNGTLGDMVQRVVGGGTPSRAKANYWNGSIPWASVKDISASPRRIAGSQECISEFGLRNSASNLIAAGTPIIATRMAVGAVTQASQVVAINQDLKALIPAEGIDETYLRYGIEGIQSKIASESVGSTVKGITVSRLLTIPIQFTRRVEEQRRIAAILSALDVQIEKTEALIEKLLLQRAGVVQQSLLPLAEKAQDYQLGMLASLVTSGSRGWGKYYSEYGALFLRIGNLTREHPNLRLNDVVRVKVPAGGEGERTRVQEGDLLISITADLGVIGCIPAGFEEAYVNQHIALVRIGSERVHPRWVAHVLGSPYGAEQFLALNATGAKAGLNLPSVRRLRVPCPTLNKQQALVDILDSMDLAVEAERRYLQKLRIQKAGLMRDLLTGKVRVTTEERG